MSVTITIPAKPVEPPPVQEVVLSYALVYGESFISAHTSVGEAEFAATLRARHYGFKTYEYSVVAI